MWFVRTSMTRILFMDTVQKQKLVLCKTAGLNETSVVFRDRIVALRCHRVRIVISVCILV